METDIFDDPLLTLMGLLVESCNGAMEHAESGYPFDSRLTTQLFEPLLRLARTPGGRLRMTDLAAQCRYNASALTRIADRLAELGLAERIDCPSDRRVIHLSITDAGRRTVLDALPAHIHVLESAVFGALSSDERETLGSLLRKVRDSVHPDAARQSGTDVAPASVGGDLDD